MLLLSPMNRLRHLYTALIFADYAAAVEHDAERSLWKHCFYRPVEEQRKVVRALAARREQERSASAKDAGGVPISRLAVCKEGVRGGWYLLINLCVCVRCRSSPLL